MFLGMQNKENPRALSHDERYAAEAAFAGRPLNPRWSARAKAVYEGIQKSLPTQEISDPIVDPELSEEPLATMPVPTESLAESAQPSDRSTGAETFSAGDRHRCLDRCHTDGQTTRLVVFCHCDEASVGYRYCSDQHADRRGTVWQVARRADGAQASPDGAADHGAFDRFSGIIGVSPRRNPPAGSAVCLSATGRAASGDGNVAASHRGGDHDHPDELIAPRLSFRTTASRLRERTPCNDASRVVG